MTTPARRSARVPLNVYLFHNDTKTVDHVVEVNKNSLRSNGSLDGEKLRLKIVRELGFPDATTVYIGEVGRRAGVRLDQHATDYIGESSLNRYGFSIELSEIGAGAGA
jgi:hypothetical protein